MKIATFPFIAKAAELIAYDNCAINRLEPFDVERFDIPYSLEDLGWAEKCLCELTDEALETVCMGEVTEAKAILERNFKPEYAELTYKVLNSIFEVI